MSEINTNNDLDEVFEETMDDSTVITVPIDETLTHSGEAADAKAVGDALDLKANAADINTIKVNAEEADNQGQIYIDGTGIPMSGTDATTLQEAIAAEQDKTGADIPLTTDEQSETIAEAVAALETATTGIVKKVNNTSPDGTGNVTINKVPLADNLDSTSKQTSSGEYIIRMTGGNASLSDGPANLLQVLGNTVRTGHEDEQITFTVTSQTCSASITNMATFRSEMGESGTLTLTYTTEWSADPADYGITVTGSPTNGDTIVAVWVEEVPGTCTSAEITGFSSTGWNLFQLASGVARVLKYSNTYGFGIAGTYTALQYSATETGGRSTITPNSAGLFTIPGDGFLWVTGGDNTTAIWATWSDWTDGYHGNFEAYNKTTISLTAIMSSCFPYGLCGVGAVRDYIDLAGGYAYSWVQVLENTAENMSAAAASGRSYTYDGDYIYLARASAVVTSLTGTLAVNASYTACDHGMEMFDGAEVPVGGVTNYGIDLRNRLERDVLTISQQTLTAAQQEQARENIGAVSQEDLAKIGTYPPAVSGQYTTAAWTSGSWSSGGIWSAPEDGIYLAYMWIQLNSEYSGIAYRKYYRQLQMQGTCTKLLQNALYYDTGVSQGADGGFEGRSITQPIYAKAGQTLYPYIHTDAVGCVYDYKIFCIRIA